MNPKHSRYRHRFTHFTDALIPVYNWGFRVLAGRQHEAFREHILELASDKTRLRGLMTIGYRGASDDERRRSFAALRQLLDQCQQRFGKSMTELSMGMSGDFEPAIEEGATMVRVGTALFGPRR